MFEEFVCGFLEAAPLPQTPDNLTMAGLADSLASDIPFLGSAFVYAIVSDILKVLTMVAGIKFYKLLPGKFS